VATKSFKDLPKQSAPLTLDQLQAQLKAAQGGAPVPAAPTPVPVADEPVVVATGAGAPIDVPAQMPAAPTGTAVSNPLDFMALMTGAVAPQDSMNALLAAAETDSAGGKMLFPMLTQAGGTTGGAFQRVNTKNAEFNQIDLPEGKRSFDAIFIGYRYMGTCWPKGYDANAVNAKAPSPLWNAAIPQARGQEAAQLMLAGKAFQFSKNRKAFDVDAGGPGLIRPAIEFLLFDADIGLFVFRTCGHYNSAKDARDQLIACAITDANGNQQLPPFMGEFHPETHRQARATGQPIIHHYPRIVKIANNDARVAAASVAYKTFLQNASPELRASVNEWFNAQDAPLTNIATQAINDAAAMG
jgi:hypothetical protein